MPPLCAPFGYSPFEHTPPAAPLRMSAPPTLCERVPALPLRRPSPLFERPNNHSPHLPSHPSCTRTRCPHPHPSPAPTLAPTRVRQLPAHNAHRRRPHAFSRTHARPRSRTPTPPTNTSCAPPRCARMPVAPHTYPRVRQSPRPTPTARNLLVQANPTLLAWPPVALRTHTRHTLTCPRCTHSRAGKPVPHAQSSRTPLPPPPPPPPSHPSCTRTHRSRKPCPKRPPLARRTPTLVASTQAHSSRAFQHIPLRMPPTCPLRPPASHAPPSNAHRPLLMRAAYRTTRVTYPQTTLSLHCTAAHQPTKPRPSRVRSLHPVPFQPYAQSHRPCAPPSLRPTYCPPCAHPRMLTAHRPSWSRRPLGYAASCAPRTRCMSSTCSLRPAPAVYTLRHPCPRTPPTSTPCRPCLPRPPPPPQPGPPPKPLSVGPPPLLYFFLCTSDSAPDVFSQISTLHYLPWYSYTTFAVP
ncbi:hypothetical protein K438DRAFT_1980592 [Mycena galopus ATCC 62051]|nr:hypothetical protein K438DRAFT_1980592 [Mycena galopus ATCC 62051]